MVVVVVIDGHDVCSNLIVSQFDLHARYGGVVSELASRAHLERLDSLIRETMAQASIAPEHIDALAVTAGPGLIGALLIGVTAAKTLAWTWGKPLIDVNHIHAHAVSAGAREKIEKAGGKVQLIEPPAPAQGEAAATRAG